MATIIAFPGRVDPVRTIRLIEQATGLVATFRGSVAVLVKPISAAPLASVLPFRQVRDVIPAFLRRGAPRPDPDGPRAA